MKEQYVGDENDYRKYALLRQLANAGVRIGVCWMLTPPDDGSDGGKTAYLKRPDRWRAHDPDLFDVLRSVHDYPGVRRLRLIERSGVIPKALFFNEHLSHRSDLRSVFFTAAWSELKSADLIFFDPDNGFEVASTPKGRAASSKFIYHDEIAETYKRGHSVLVYQHFPRQPRGQVIHDLATKLVANASGARLWCFRTPQIAFLMLIHPHHAQKLTEAAESAVDRWGAGFLSGTAIPATIA